MEPKYQSAEKVETFTVNPEHAEEGRKWADVYGPFLLQALEVRNLSQVETKEFVPLQSWAIAKMVHAMVQDGTIIVGKRHRGKDGPVWEYRLPTSPLGTSGVGEERQAFNPQLPEFHVDETLAEEGFSPTRNPDYDLSRDCGWDEHPDADGPRPEEWSGPSLFWQYSPTLKTLFRQQRCLTFLEIKQHIEFKYRRNMHTLTVNKILHAMADQRIIWAVRCRDTSSRQYWSYFLLDSNTVEDPTGSVVTWEPNPRFVREAKTEFTKGEYSTYRSYIDELQPFLPTGDTALTLTQIIKAFAVSHKQQAAYAGTVIVHYLVSVGKLAVKVVNGVPYFAQA